MNRTWITCNKLSLEYSIGITDLLNFAILNPENQMSIRCPCTSYCNMEFHLKKVFLQNIEFGLGIVRLTMFLHLQNVKTINIIKDSDVIIIVA